MPSDKIVCLRQRIEQAVSSDLIPAKFLAKFLASIIGRIISVGLGIGPVS